MGLRFEFFMLRSARWITAEVALHHRITEVASTEAEVVCDPKNKPIDCGSLGALTPDPLSAWPSFT